MDAADAAAPADRVPQGLTPEAARDWAALASDGPAPGLFTPAAVAGLPEPVRRWLTHAVSEGTPLARTVQLRTHGEIFLGRWAGFTADQRLSVGGGFVWSATARLLGLPIRGFDRWTHGTGEMRWRLIGAVPMASASGEDVTSSAAGRHAGELRWGPLRVLRGAALRRDAARRGQQRRDAGPTADHRGLPLRHHRWAEGQFIRWTVEDIRFG